MSRGGSYGGGQSSLGYLFGSEEPQTPPPAAKPPVPPYGIDTTTITTDDQKPSSDHQTPSNSNNYRRADGQNSGNFLTDRPSTKVNSVPGGDSSLGYLFGDK